MAANKQGKMINYRMKITLNDGRQMVGQMVAFDKHMNVVLADTEEFRRVKRRLTKGGAAPGAAAPALVESEEKRTLGLTIAQAHRAALEEHRQLWRRAQASAGQLEEVCPWGSQDQRLGLEDQAQQDLVQAFLRQLASLDHQEDHQASQAGADHQVDH
ncbi:Small nuclear ribonucleoprotein-associated protein B, partial [Cryomyces antarcticus]